MGSNDSDPMTNVPGAADSGLAVGSPAPPAPSKDDQESGRADEIHSAGEFADELQALKKKILELEQQANAGIPGARQDESRQDESREDERRLDEVQHGLMTDLEQYRRMEACLYKHRKEWETNVGPGDWGVKDLHRRGYMLNRKTAPWTVNWTYTTKRQYERPNPFHSSHRCEDDQDSSSSSEVSDDFDQIIDYGDRRERLRKNFEWELDRLYLNEEMSRRRELKAKKLEAERKRTSSGTGFLSAFAKPKLNPVPWSSFKKLADIIEKEACVVDVLIGEPAIDGARGGPGQWYGYSDRQVNKLDTSEDPTGVPTLETGQLALPERIRIHSAALTKIIDSLGGTPRGKADESVDSEREDGPFVIIRPFKPLVYYEQALRDWCKALEKKFGDASEKSKTVTDIDGPASERGAGSTEVSTGDVTTSGKSATNNAVPVTDNTPETQGGSNAEVVRKKYTSQRQGGSVVRPKDDPDDLTKSPTALEHLNCLLSFVDSYLTPKRTYLSDPKCGKVFFSDLWHLFRPGVEVIGSDGKQAYRVIQVASANHKVTSAWERWFSPLDDKLEALERSDRRFPPPPPSQRLPPPGGRFPPYHRRKSKPAFTLTCVYIDFDGKEFGPVPKVFNFKRFDGERDVSSLDVYPLRFHPVKRADFTDAEWAHVQALPQAEIYRKKLILRGARFLDVAAVKHMYYAGTTLETREEVESQVVIDFETAFSGKGKVPREWRPDIRPMINYLMTKDDDQDDEEPDKECRADCCQHEPALYDDSTVDGKQGKEYIDSLLPERITSNEQPSIAIMPRPFEEIRGENSGTLRRVSDDELCIMSYRVFGFVLRSRKWAKLDLSHLSDVHESEASAAVEEDNSVAPDTVGKKQSTTAFDRLVLEKWHRNIIVSLIAQHFRDRKSATHQREEFDIVKGKGLILLLHGAPGVGKTSTAEGVAELFKRPLFQITCGDLGTTAATVEETLETAFTLASRWDCILLLDEADVFLAERGIEDFKRNGLVAVFLRIMEYYSGILFLTTNRIGVFDEAFQSRVHMSLYYPDLNDSKTLDVFKINMEIIEERFQRNGRRISIDKVGIDSFAAQYFRQHPKARWNGRQIRNACQTALALAEFEAQGSSHEAILKPEALVTLNVRHFETVRDAYLEFAKYMTKVYGTNAAQRAKESNLRAIWTENENALAMGGRGGSTVVDKRTAFHMESQPPRQQQTQQYPQQVPQQQPQHYQYQTFAVPQQVYSDPGHMSMQAGQFPAMMPWAMPGAAPVLNPPSLQASSDRQTDTAAPQQTPVPQQHSQQQQQNPPSFIQGIHAMYEASGSQGAAGQMSFPPAGTGPGQQWPGPQGVAGPQRVAGPQGLAAFQGQPSGQ